MPAKTESVIPNNSEKTIFPLGLTNGDILNVMLKIYPGIKSESVRVISTNVQEINDAEKFGLSGDYFFLDLQFQVEEEHENKQRFFIKSLPLNCPIERNRVKNLKLFDREKTFYLNLDKAIQKNNFHFSFSPRIYTITDNFLLMEDLQGDGYESAANINLTKDQIKACLLRISQMHAQNIALKGQDGLKPKPVNILFEDDFYGSHDPWVLSGISTIKKLAMQDSRNQTERRQGFIENELTLRILQKLEQFQMPNDFFKVLCHGDLRPKNIYLQKDVNDPENGINFMFTDFQQVRYLPPAVDVLLFLYYNLRKPLPNEELVAEYVKFYYEKLQSSCEKLKVDLGKYLTYESFDDSVKYYKVLALIFRAMQAPFLCNSSYAITQKKNDMLKYIHCMSIDRSEMIRFLSEQDRSLELFVLESNQNLIDSLSIET